LKRADSIRCVSVVHCVVGYVPEPGTSVDYVRIRLQSRCREREGERGPHLARKPEINHRKSFFRGGKKPAAANRPMRISSGRGLDRPISRREPPDGPAPRLGPKRRGVQIAAFSRPASCQSFGSSPVSVAVCSDSYLTHAGVVRVDFLDKK
jgi:hypothetical protein